MSILNSIRSSYKCALKKLISVKEELQSIYCSVSRIINSTLKKVKLLIETFYSCARKALNVGNAMLKTYLIVYTCMKVYPLLTFMVQISILVLRCSIFLLQILIRLDMRFLWLVIIFYTIIQAFEAISEV